MYLKSLPGAGAMQKDSAHIAVFKQFASRWHFSLSSRKVCLSEHFRVTDSCMLLSKAFLVSWQTALFRLQTSYLTFRSHADSALAPVAEHTGHWNVSVRVISNTVWLGFFKPVAKCLSGRSSRLSVKGKSEFYSLCNRYGWLQFSVEVKCGEINAFLR